MEDAAHTVTNLTVHLICEGKDMEARAELDKDPVPTVEWLYLNALLKFREVGDCIQSRSAAAAALSDSPMIAIALNETEAAVSEEEDKEENKEEGSDDDDDDDDESDLNDLYASVTQPAWKSTEGALQWLSKQLENEPRLFGAAEHPDEVRLKKWQREFELADSNLRREDFKSTKRSFKAALREYDALNDGGDMFILTASMLGTFLQATEDSLEELQVAFDRKIAWLDKQEREDIEGLFTSYSEFAKVLMKLDMHKSAQHCAEIALTLYEKSIDQGAGKLNFHDGAGCLFMYACMLSEQENFAEAERRFSQLTEIQEEYLGKGHLSLVEGMMGWRFCLHQLKRHEEEKVIYDRLYAIDKHFDADDEYRFVCDAALVKAE